MGRPDVVWSPKGDSEGGGIGAAEAQRVRSAFRAAFAQAGHGGLLISEFPGTLQPLQWAPQDIVEIERAKAIKTDICNVFGVPDAKLERNASNLAAARTADYAHTKDAGVPRCLRSEETLNARLVPMFDPSGRLFVAYDSPVREDEVFAFEQSRALRCERSPDPQRDSRQSWTGPGAVGRSAAGAGGYGCRRWGGQATDTKQMRVKAGRELPQMKNQMNTALPRFARPQSKDEEPRRREAAKTEAKRGEQNVWRKDGRDAQRQTPILLSATYFLRFCLRAFRCFAALHRFLTIARQENLRSV